MDLPETLDCGHEPQPTYYTAGSAVHVGSRVLTMTGNEVMFPGYATTPDNRKVCPDCADDLQREDMKTAERFMAYLSRDRQRLVTWTGGTLGRVTSFNSNTRQTFVHVVDVHGQHWAGIGPAESGTYVSLRRLKRPRR